MINYLNLPNEMKSLIKDFDYVNLTKQIVNHNWKYIPLGFVLTKEGKAWFSDKKIPIKTYAALFKIPKNFEGPIHVDTHKHERADCAFNFVLSGYGEMQWITNLEAIEHNVNHNNGDYIQFRDIKNFTISDTWTGSVGLVRIGVPHRVVTTDSERYCISIRLNAEILPNTFDEISNLFGV